MAPFEMLTRIFRVGLAKTLEPESAQLLQLINIELEELDHDGRRSLGRRRKPLPNKPVVVCLLLILTKQTLTKL